MNMARVHVHAREPLRALGAITKAWDWAAQIVPSMELSERKTEAVPR